MSRYNIANESLYEMPDLNIARTDASACSIGDNIYVFGGNIDDEAIKSIEKLSNPGLIRNKAYWKLI